MHREGLPGGLPILLRGAHKVKLIFKHSSIIELGMTCEPSTTACKSNQFFGADGTIKLLLQTILVQSLRQMSGFATGKIIAEKIVRKSTMSRKVRLCFRRPVLPLRYVSRFCTLPQFRTWAKGSLLAEFEY